MRGACEQGRLSLHIQRAFSFTECAIGCMSEHLGVLLFERVYILTVTCLANEHLYSTCRMATAEQISSLYSHSSAAKLL